MQAKRRNGFSKPRSSDQLTTWVLYPVCTVAYYLLVCGVLSSSSSPLVVHLLWLESVLVLFVLVTWFLAEAIDPETKSSSSASSSSDVKSRDEDAFFIRVICFPHSTTRSRFCGTCRKSVLGLDHHCTWLNTCIGARNYVPFLVMVMTCLAQMTLQTATGVLLQTTLLQDDETRNRVRNAFGGQLVGYHVLASLFTILSGTLGLGLLVLASLHCYLLLWQRQGTYDWMLGNRGSLEAIPPSSSANNVASDEVEMKRQLEREEWQKNIEMRNKEKGRASSYSVQQPVQPARELLLDNDDSKIDSKDAPATISRELTTSLTEEA